MEFSDPSKSTGLIKSSYIQYAGQLSKTAENIFKSLVTCFLFKLVHYLRYITFLVEINIEISNIYLADSKSESQVLAILK